MALSGSSVVQEIYGSLWSDWERKQQQAYAVPDQGENKFTYQIRSEGSDGLRFQESGSPSYHQLNTINAPGWGQRTPQVDARASHVADGDPWCSFFADVQGMSDHLTELYPQPFQIMSTDSAASHGFTAMDYPYEDGGIAIPNNFIQSFKEQQSDDHESTSLSRNPQSSFADIYRPSSFQPSHKSDQLPPASDHLHYDKPGLIPHRQEIRFLGDLYTPTYVRGAGKMREGWCGICKPGRWLLLKTSAFWYDKAFTHGISAATGAPFDDPKEMRPTHGQTHFWEGMCGTCGEWIALMGNTKRGTSWFRHAYKVCKELSMVHLRWWY